MNESIRRLSAVFFSDIVGFTKLTATDEAAAMRLVEILQRSSYAVVEKRFRGRIVKFIGDAVLAEFPSTDAAVRAALALQEEFTRVAAVIGKTGQLRTAVHLGEVIVSADGDIYGDGVNTASRLQTHAQPGRVVVSEDVWRQLRTRRSFEFSARGQMELRDLPGPIGLFDVEAGTLEDHDTQLPVTDRRRITMFPPASEPRLKLLARYAGLALPLLITTGMLAWPRLQRPHAQASLTGGQPFVAVVTTEPPSATSQHRVFSAGLSEALQVELGSSPALMVAQRSFTAPYQARTDVVGALSRDVGVTAVLQATAKWSGNRIRLIGSLLEAPSGRPIWQGEFEKVVTDEFDAQSELAKNMADTVEAVLAHKRGGVKKDTVRLATEVVRAPVTAPKSVKPAEKKPATLQPKAEKKSTPHVAAKELKEFNRERAPSEVRKALEKYGQSFARGDKAAMKALFPTAKRADLKGLTELPQSDDIKAEIGSLQIRELDAAKTVVNLIVVFRTGETTQPLPYRAQLAHVDGSWRITAFARR